MGEYDDFLLEQRVRFGGLLDAYASLLSERQRVACETLLEGDLSVPELGDALGMTRQGAHDLLRRSRDRLEEIERVLGLLELRERHEGLLAIIAKAESSLPQDFVEGLKDAGLLPAGKGE